MAGTMFVAFIRGINVGRAKRVAMADLRALMGKLGYTEVRTVLNSGNVIFGAASGKAGDHAARIEEAMTKHLEVSARVVALTATELRAVIEGDPVGKVAKEPSRYLVAIYCDADVRKALQPLAKDDWGNEVFGVGRHAAYMWCPEGLLNSALAGAVGKAAPTGTTIRNWATLSKVDALVRDR